MAPLQRQSHSHNHFLFVQMRASRVISYLKTPTTLLERQGWPLGEYMSWGRTKENHTLHKSFFILYQLSNSFDIKFKNSQT